MNTWIALGNSLHIPVVCLETIRADWHMRIWKVANDKDLLEGVSTGRF
jgi:hypothetical protein